MLKSHLGNVNGLFFFFNIYFMYLCIYLFLAVSSLSCSMQDLSLQPTGFSLVRCRLSSCGVGSVVAAHGLSCPTACGILVPLQGSNPCPLHWKADSQPLDHQGSPLSTDC